MRGYIDDLKDKIKLLQEVKWVNNKTRSLMLEFSVYNAQVNIYSIGKTLKGQRVPPFEHAYI